MDCPACGKKLSQSKAGEIEIDVCKEGCGGVWFDRDEIVKFDEQHEFATSEILAVAEKLQGVHVDHAARKTCPRCAGEHLVRQFFDVKNEVEIDQCWNCGGVWLDTGEINKIRAQYKTYEDRARAVNEYVDGNLESIKEQMAAQGKEEVARYDAETRNVVTSFLFGFKKLLGLDDPYDSM